MDSSSGVLEAKWEAREGMKSTKSLGRAHARCVQDKVKTLARNARGGKGVVDRER